MFYDKSDPDFPNWWEVIDEEGNSSESGEPAVENAEEAETVETEELAGGGEPDSADSPAIRYLAEEEEDLAPRFSKSDEEHVEEDGPAYEVGSEYDREIVCRVWEFAEAIPGNDASLWRKDEYGNWIYRLDYGKRESEFGWEIFDPAPGRHGRGVYAMRPLQWESYVKQFEARG